jgi:hypothetical protein
MGKSGILNSMNYGNWVDENVLTSLKMDETKYDIFSSTVIKYAEELSITKMSNRVKYGETALISEKNSPKLQFPKIKHHYDIARGNKYSKKVQNWRGVISQMNATSFVARLEDLTKGGTDELGEFDFSDISDDDKKLIRVGAIFYWSVGLYMEHGQIAKRSDIRFQRLILLDEDDIDKTRDDYKKKFANLKFETIDYKPSQRL